MEDLSLTNRPENEEKLQSTRSLNRQVVLDEDEYTAALSEIIARDFFPSLVHLDATNNYLDALKTNDPQLINASVRHLQDISTPSLNRNVPYQTPSQTPWAAGPSDTPLRTPREADRPAKRPRFNTNMSLDDFQAKYTSEDNSSFTAILDDENKDRREKYSWAWEAQKRVEAQRKYTIEQRERLLIEPSLGPGIREKLVIEAPRPAGLLTQEEEEKVDSKKNVEKDSDEIKSAPENSSNSLIVLERKETPEDGTVVDVLARKKDTRPAGVNGWKFKARNALMFPPDADASPYAITSAASSSNKGAAKIIKYGNTRLPEQEESTDITMEPPSPTRSRIDAAIAGTPYHPRTGEDQFSLLPAVPSPTPAELGPVAVKQLMTWGTLNATPRVLSKSDDPAELLEPPSTPFHIPRPSARETIGHRLSNNASKSLRAKAAMMSGGVRSLSSLGNRTPGRSADGSMPPPNWTPRKADAAGALTPAGRRLLNRTTIGVASSRRAEAMDKTAGWEGSTTRAKERELNKIRWTPSPAPVSKKR